MEVCNGGIGGWCNDEAMEGLDECYYGGCPRRRWRGWATNVTIVFSTGRNMHDGWLIRLSNGAMAEYSRPQALKTEEIPAIVDRRCCLQWLKKWAMFELH